jgi:hypothetical protein
MNQVPELYQRKAAALTVKVIIVAVMEVAPVPRVLVNVVLLVKMLRTSRHQIIGQNVQDEEKELLLQFEGGTSTDVGRAVQADLEIDETIDEGRIREKEIEIGIETMVGIEGLDMDMIVTGGTETAMGKVLNE